MDNVMKLASESPAFFVGLIAGGVLVVIVILISVVIGWLILNKYFVKRKEHNRKNDVLLNGFKLENQEEHSLMKESLAKIETHVEGINKKFDAVAWQGQVDARFEGVEKRLDFAEGVSMEATKAMNRVAAALAEKK